CRFWVNGARGLIASAAPRLLLEDCLITGAFSETFLSLGLHANLVMHNNLVLLGGGHAIVAAGDQILELTDNYIEPGPTPFLRPPLDEAPARPVKVVAEGNIIGDCLLLGDTATGMPSAKIARTQVDWRGKNNLYVHSARPFLSFAQDKRELKNL